MRVSRSQKRGIYSEYICVYLFSNENKVDSVQGTLLSITKFLTQGALRYHACKAEALYKDYQVILRIDWSDWSSVVLLQQS